MSTWSTYLVFIKSIFCIVLFGSCRTHCRYPLHVCHFIKQSQLVCFYANLHFDPVQWGWGIQCAWGFQMISYARKCLCSSFAILHLSLCHFKHGILHTCTIIHRCRNSANHFWSDQTNCTRLTFSLDFHILQPNNDFFSFIPLLRFFYGNLK